MDLAKVKQEPLEDLDDANEGHITHEAKIVKFEPVDVKVEHNRDVSPSYEALVPIKHVVDLKSEQHTNHSIQIQVAAIKVPTADLSYPPSGLPEVHNETESLKCQVCEYTCSSREYLLKVHMQTHSPYLSCLGPNDKLYECTECNYKGLFRRNLLRHINTHAIYKAYQCPNCDYRTNRKDHLNAHVRTHTGEKPYKCDRCNFKSNAKRNLMAHKHMHEETKPYQCDKCNFKTTWKANIVKHMSIHSSDKPYQCDKCNYHCIWRSSLLDHMLTHSDKNYKCKQCRYKCVKEKYLIKHMEKRHKTITARKSSRKAKEEVEKLPLSKEVDTEKQNGNLT